MLNTIAANKRSAKLRSRFTNDPSFLPGVDRRTRDGRRYQDIVLAVVSEFGAANPVALREIAALRFTLEREQGAIVSGDQRSLEDLVRLTNAIERKERALRLAKRRQSPASVPAALRDRLSSKYGGAP